MSDKKTDKDELLARMEPVFDIFSQSYVCDSSLYSHRKPSARQLQDPVIIDADSIVSGEKSMEKYRSVMSSPFSRKKVFEYIEGILGEKGSGDFSGIEADKADDYIMTLMAVKESSSKQSFYNIQFTEERPERRFPRNVIHLLHLAD
jgi:hypothetical protein